MTPDDLKQAITQAFIDMAAEQAKAKRKAKAETSAENGKQGGRPPAPEHATTATEFVRDRLKDKDGKLLVRHWHGEWWRFCGVAGWRPQSDCEIQNAVISYLRERADLAKYATCNYAASVMLNLRAHDLCGLMDTVTRPCWLDTGEDARHWMGFANGVCLDVWAAAAAIAGGADITAPGAAADFTRPLGPDFFSTDFTDYPLEFAAPMSELFQAYLARVQPELDGATAVQRLMGLVMADSTRYEVFFQLYGHGANGKTVALDIIKALVGRGNVSYVPLQGLIERFQAWPLAHSKANICGELPTDVGRGQFHAIEGMFKDVVSGGDIEIEKKGKDKHSGRCRARFVMSTNSLPTFMDKSDGIWRRLRIIPFPVQIPDAEKDVNLAAKIIKAEMPGVFLWALDGLASVIAAGNLPDCEAGAAIKAAHRTSCDHESEFFREKYQAGRLEDRIEEQSIYEAYREWMEAAGYRPLGRAKMVARLLEVFPQSKHGAMRFDGGKVARGIDCLLESGTLL